METERFMSAMDRAGLAMPYTTIAFESDCTVIVSVMIAGQIRIVHTPWAV